MVHKDAVTMTCLILHLNHIDVMIGIFHLNMITKVIGIIETSPIIGITNIDLGITVLATMIGDIETQMVSPRLETLMTYSGNDHNRGDSSYNSSSSLSALSSFITHNGVTFDLRRNQGFLNTCTEK